MTENEAKLEVVQEKARRVVAKWDSIKWTPVAPGNWGDMNDAVFQLRQVLKTTKDTLYVEGEVDKIHATYTNIITRARIKAGTRVLIIIKNVR